MPDSNRDDFTVTDVLDDHIRVNPAARAALIAFKRSKPFRGTVDERLVKFQTACAALADAYGFDVPTIRLLAIDPNTQGNGAFIADTNLIVLVGHLSVVTFLHCIAKARGRDHREACGWSLSVFKRFFPRSFAACDQVGFTLVRRDTPVNDDTTPDDFGEGC